MIIKEKKEIQQYVCVGIRCDACGKEIKTGHTPSNWHSFIEINNGWGNDSCDSIVEHHVCSPKCYFIEIEKVVNSFHENTDAQVDDFELQFAKLLIEYIKNENDSRA